MFNQCIHFYGKPSSLNIKLKLLEYNDDNFDDKINIDENLLKIMKLTMQ